jgi:Cu-processing system permease protein
MFRGIVLVARFALKEAMRKKMMLAAGVLTTLYLLLFGLGLHFLRGSINQMVEIAGFQIFSMGLYMATLLTGLLAAFTGVGAISGEIETGTAYALLVKPISRTQLLLGKFLGYALMMAIYAGLFFLAIWLLFAWQFGLSLPGVWRVLPLFLFQPLIMLGVAFLGSTLFSTLANGITLFLLYGVALVGGMIEQIGAMLGPISGGHTSVALINIGIVSSLALPVDSLYRRAVYILLSQHNQGFSLLNGLGPFGGTSAPSGLMVVYAIAYLAVCLLLASSVFSRRDI